MTTSSRCERCGTVIDTSEWHPVAVSERGDDLQVLAFCSTRCQDRWERDEGA